MAKIPTDEQIREEHLEILQKDSGVIFIDPTLDYWTSLEHQYAGMAMQGLIIRDHNIDDIVSISDEIATALVEKMKNKEE